MFLPEYIFLIDLCPIDYFMSKLLYVRHYHKGPVINYGEGGGGGATEGAI